MHIQQYGNDLKTVLCCTFSAGGNYIFFGVSHAGSFEAQIVLNENQSVKLQTQKENIMKFETTSKLNGNCANPRRIKGQGLTEYVIILMLIAIASIVSVSYFGSSVKASFLALGADLTGGTVVDRTAATNASFGKADAATKGVTTLQNYNQ